MSDIGLFYDIANADIEIFQNDIKSDNGFVTSVLLSLFTDRISNVSDSLPDSSGYRRGWWPDQFSVALNDLHGSRLWLLSREKQLQNVLDRAKEYTEEALKWMLDDRITDKIEVTTEALKPKILAISVLIYRPNKEIAEFRFDLNWQQQKIQSLTFKV